MGKIAYAIAVGLTYAFIAVFETGCAGGRIYIGAERYDTLTENRSTVNNTVGELWNGLFGDKKEGGK